MGFVKGLAALLEKERQGAPQLSFGHDPEDGGGYLSLPVATP